MTTHVSPANPADPMRGLASLTGRNYPVGLEKTLLRAEYLLLRNITLWPQKIAAAKHRVQQLQKLLADMTNGLAEVSNLAISVPEAKDNKYFASHVRDNPEQLTKVNQALERFFKSYVSTVHPSGDAPGTSQVIMTGQSRLPSGQLQEVPGRTVTTYAYRPALASGLPDFAFLDRSNRPVSRLYVEAPPATDTVAAGPSAQQLYIARYALPVLDPSVHSGADIAKVMKVLQAEIDNLNKTFNVEFGDSSHFLSLQNTANQMVKEFFERRMQVTLKCFGA